MFSPWNGSQSAVALAWYLVHLFVYVQNCHDCGLVLRPLPDFISHGCEINSGSGLGMTFLRLQFHILLQLCILWIGMEHTVSIACCQCEPLAVTVVRAWLWPATAQNLHLAFTFDLLDWAEALTYECQVALKDLWAALQFSVLFLITWWNCFVNNALTLLYVFTRYSHGQMKS